MSAFVVSDETINRILSTLNHGTERQKAYRLVAIAQADGTPGSIETLGHALFAFNLRAVDARYGKGEARTFRDPWADYQYRPTAPVSKVATLKALNCFLYQCTESDVPETPLFQALKDLSNHWAHDIVSNLPEYDRAPWNV